MEKTETVVHGPGLMGGISGLAGNDSRLASIPAELPLWAGAVILGAPDRNPDPVFGDKPDRLSELPQPSARARAAS